VKTPLLLDIRNAETKERSCAVFIHNYHLCNLSKLIIIIAVEVLNIVIYIIFFFNKLILTCLIIFIHYM